MLLPAHTIAGTNGAMGLPSTKGTAMINKLDDALRFHQTALNVRGYRQQLLASNIANADTPHFKARDVDFKSALQAALGGKSGTLPLVRTSIQHLAPQGTSPFNAAIQYRTEMQSSVDGNTVNLDVERGQFAENAVQYEASLTFINGMLRTIQTAMQGQ
jgi:flagellar basal-body rod protein FlgB